MTVEEAIAAALLEDPAREDWTIAQWFAFLAPDPAVVLHTVIYANGALAGTLGASSEEDLVSRQVAALLETAGLGQYGVDIFIGSKPPEPDACIVVTDAGGASPQPRFALDYPRVQILVRGPRNDYVEAMQKAIAVKKALHGYRQTTDFLRGITLSGEILPLGMDESNEREEISLNFDLWTQPADGGNRIDRI